MDPDVKSLVCGYLWKYSDSRVDEEKWKERYFILHGNVLSCYINHRNLEGRRGELLIFRESKVECVARHEKDFCLQLSRPFDGILLAAANEGDQLLWKNALDKTIEDAQRSLRGFMWKVSQNGIKKEKLFILHENAISYHNDAKTLVVQGFIVFQPGVTVEGDETLQTIAIHDHHSDNCIRIEFVRAEPGGKLDVSKYGEYYIWKSRLDENFARALRGAGVSVSPMGQHSATVSNADVNEVRRIDRRKLLKEGELGMKPSRDDVDVSKWRKCHFCLESGSLMALDYPAAITEEKMSTRNKEISIDGDLGQDEDGPVVIAQYLLAPNSAVFETSLGEFTFELVASNRILNASAPSRHVQLSWISAIRRAIVDVIVNYSDPLFLHALLHIDNDEYYEVHFLEKCSLGIIFERCGEWAIVKSSHQVQSTGVSVGSVLASVNGENVLLSKFRSTVGRLRNWQSPLTMTFRRVPRKEGFLLKWCRESKNSEKRLWKKKYFLLEGGFLTYKDFENDAQFKQSFQLIGSSVSMSPEEVSPDGSSSCFRFLCHSTSILLQGLTKRQSMEWASYLYHAIAIANGGTYILEYEMDRMRAVEEETAQVEAVLVDDSLPTSGNSIQEAAVKLLEDDEESDTIELPVNEDSKMVFSDVSARPDVPANDVNDAVMNEAKEEIKRSFERAKSEWTMNELSEALLAAEHAGFADVEVEKYHKLLKELKADKLRGYLTDALLLLRDKPTSIAIDVVSKLLSEPEVHNLEPIFVAFAKIELFVNDAVLRMGEKGWRPMLENAWLGSKANNSFEREFEQLLTEWADHENCSTTVLRLASSRFLEESLKCAVVSDFRLLEAATPIAVFYRCDEQLCGQAESLLARLRRECNSQESMEQLLRAALDAADSTKIEFPLHRLRKLGCGDLAIIQEAEEFLARMIREESCSRVITQLGDAMRLRSQEALQRALFAAKEHNVTGELVDIAQEYVEKLVKQSSSSILVAEGSSMASPRAADAKERITAATAKAWQTFAPSIQRRKSLFAGGAIAIKQVTPRTNERTSSHVFDFMEIRANLKTSARSDSSGVHDDNVLSSDMSDLIDPSSRESPTVDDVVRVFKKYGSKSGTVNAMQFSTLWRQLTKEKGNLYKEMQMFKLFDTESNGSIIEKDFIDGWRKVSRTKEGPVLMSRLKVFAEQL